MAPTLLDVRPAQILLATKGHRGGTPSGAPFSSSSRKLLKFLIAEPLNLHVVVRLSGIALARAGRDLNQLALGQNWYDSTNSLASRGTLTEQERAWETRVARKTRKKASNSR